MADPAPPRSEALASLLISGRGIIVNIAAKCPKCDGEMKEGFILDATHARNMVARWISGLPKRTILGGADIDGKDQHKIKSFRCIRCGYLESYASPDGVS